MSFQAAFGVREASVGIFTAPQTNRTKTISNANPPIMVCLRVGLGAVCCIQPSLRPSQKIRRKVYSISRRGHRCRARMSIIRNNKSAMSVSFFQAAVAWCRGSLKSLRGEFKLVVRRLAAYWRLIACRLVWFWIFRLPLLYAVGSLKPKWNGALDKTVFASGQMCPKSCVFSALLLRLFFRLSLHHATAA